MAPNDLAYEYEAIFEVPVSQGSNESKDGFTSEDKEYEQFVLLATIVAPGITLAVTAA
jgi:hypothetical protein